MEYRKLLPRDREELFTFSDGSSQPMNGDSRANAARMNNETPAHPERVSSSVSACAALGVGL